MIFTEHLMGTVISLELADDLPERKLRELAADTFSWLHEVDRRFSTYRHDSEVNMLHNGQIQLADCSPDLAYVLDRCADLWQETGGSFDVYATGRLDPSGYVKGWSVQVASDRLAEDGCLNHCINAGGDICLRGHPADADMWQVGIRHPLYPDKLCATLKGNDLAVATSGLYERGHHIINPHRGTAATDLLSVTVTGDDLGLCDAYSTAAIAKGRQAAAWLAELPGLKHLVITRDEQICGNLSG